jgi:hypothetical protein
MRLLILRVVREEGEKDGRVRESNGEKEVNGLQ